MKVKNWRDSSLPGTEFNVSKAKLGDVVNFSYEGNSGRGVIVKVQVGNCTIGVINDTGAGWAISWDNYQEFDKIEQFHSIRVNLDIQKGWNIPLVAKYFTSYIGNVLENSSYKAIKSNKLKYISLKKIILPEDKKKCLLDLINSHSPEKSGKLWEKWGFGSTIEKGKGLAMLFYGVPGTGKTKCAEEIANELGFKYRLVSTDELWTSEPGGCERTIKSIFQEAQKTKNMVLCFDECDSLIYNRKHLGMILSAEVNCLLSCLEKYDGISIFTTNRTPVLDPAFNRRLQLKMEFPEPSEELRATIWRALVPKKAPLDSDVDFSQLAKSTLCGGNIKNVILNAGRLAIASKARRIAMAHFMEALKQELQGMSAFNNEEESNVQKVRS